MQVIMSTQLIARSESNMNLILDLRATYLLRVTLSIANVQDSYDTQ